MSSTDLPPLKNSSANISSHTLNDGLTLVAKSLASTLQWTGQFTKIQNQHYEKLQAREKELQSMIKKSGKYRQKIVKGLSQFTQRVCRLCMQQKPADSFIVMCNCVHSFCYSCLNTYAISKIQDLERVSCPHLKCHSEMKLTSPVYKYLPQTIKLKYLQYLIKNKHDKVDFKSKCLRCLQFQHEGQCKVTLNRQTIENAFEFRKCRKCDTEAQIGQGKRKVSCIKCKHAFCYLCGQDWPDKGNHKCQQIPKIKQLQKELDNSQCCSNDCCQTYDGCCVCCECCELYGSQCCPSFHLRCCENCGQCMDNCCYCGDGCDISLIFGNVVCFILRIIFTVLLLGFYCLLLIPLSVFLAIWLALGMAIGVVMFPCDIIQNCEGMGKFLAILFCPILAIPGIVVGPKQLGDTFSSVINDYCELFSTGICDMWIYMSPNECCK